MQLVVFTDGGSRGNPGNAAIGGVVYLQDQNSVNDTQPEVLHDFSKYIGIATNNEAEYQALKTALELVFNEYFAQESLKSAKSIASEKNVTTIRCLLDSKLVVEQMKKNWKIKEPRMQQLAKECETIVKKIGVPVLFEHIPREKNKVADLLVNQALDAHSA